MMHKPLRVKGDCAYVQGIACAKEKRGGARCDVCVHVFVPVSFLRGYSPVSVAQTRLSATRPTVAQCSSCLGCLGNGRSPAPSYLERLLGPQARRTERSSADASPGGHLG